MKLTSPFVITISRQLGSGGAYIGQQLAKELNLFYADREIISMAARKFAVEEKDLTQRDEKLSPFWQSFVQTYNSGLPDAYLMPYVIATDQTLFNVESDIIKHIAKEQSSIIIGRCGYYVLRDHPNHLKIFLHADKDFRKERIQKLFKLSEGEAEKTIKQNDRDRAAYNHAFTGKDWYDATQYDMSVDTSKIGLDASFNLILQVVEK